MMHELVTANYGALWSLAAAVGVVLGLLGGGGSILMVPLLTYLGGLAPRTAIAASLVVIGATSLAASWTHARRGNVDISAALRVGVAGMAGAYLGGRLAAAVPERVLLVAFAVVMAATGVAMLRGRPRDELAAPARPFTFITVGVGVGILTGLLGAGGGFLLVPALTLLGGLRLNVAIGTSLVVIAFNSVSGLLSHLGHLDLPWVLVAGATVSALLGTLVGMRISARVPLPVLRRAFGVFVLVVGGAVLAVESRQWV